MVENQVVDQYLEVLGLVKRKTLGLPDVVDMQGFHTVIDRLCNQIVEKDIPPQEAVHQLRVAINDPSYISYVQVKSFLEQTLESLERDFGLREKSQQLEEMKQQNDEGQVTQDESSEVGQSSKEIAQLNKEKAEETKKQKTENPKPEQEQESEAKEMASEEKIKNPETTEQILEELNFENSKKENVGTQTQEHETEEQTVTQNEIKKEERSKTQAIVNKNVSKKETDEYRNEMAEISARVKFLENQDYVSRNALSRRDMIDKYGMSKEDADCLTESEKRAGKEIEVSEGQDVNDVINKLGQERQNGNCAFAYVDGIKLDNMTVANGQQMLETYKGTKAALLQRRMQLDEMNRKN